MYFGHWEDYENLRTGLKIVGSTQCLAILNDFCDWIEPLYDSEEESFDRAIDAVEADQKRIEAINNRYIDSPEDIRGLIDQHIEQLLAE